MSLMLQGLAELLLLGSYQIAGPQPQHLLYISSKPVAQIYTDFGCTNFKG